jgi:DegV family protein with EDD domain
MRKVKIVCDSGSDLPKEIADSLDIDLLPLYVIQENKEYKDGIDILPKELYDNMKVGEIYSTSQVPVEDFIKCFEKYASQNIPILYIGFSSALSGTYGTGKLASEMIKERYPGYEINTVDTKCASMGCGMVVERIARLAEAGTSLEELTKQTVWTSEHMAHIFTVDDVVYLARGGRVSKTSAFFASSFDIRPILQVDKDGNLEAIKKVHGLKKTLSTIMGLIEDMIALDADAIWISHADCIDRVELTKQMITEKFGITNFVTGFIGSVIGAHTGPNTVAIFFIKR